MQRGQLPLDGDRQHNWLSRSRGGHSGAATVNRFKIPAVGAGWVFSFDVPSEPDDNSETKIQTSLYSKLRQLVMLAKPAFFVNVLSFPLSFSPIPQANHAFSS